MFVKVLFILMYFSKELCRALIITIIILTTSRSRSKAFLLEPKDWIDPCIREIIYVLQPDSISSQGSIQM